MSDDDTTDEPFVRPYVITAGRTVGEAGDIAIETMVVARKKADDVGADHVAVVELCATHLSIAEIAAHRSIPIGVARVLVADLTASGHLEMYETAASADADVVRRLLHGIRSL